jgi:hypothetical protein
MIYFYEIYSTLGVDYDKFAYGWRILEMWSIFFEVDLALDESP